MASILGRPPPPHSGFGFPAGLAFPGAGGGGHFSPKDFGRLGSGAEFPSLHGMSMLPNRQENTSQKFF
jgi:hypothetical protein